MMSLRNKVMVCHTVIGVGAVAVVCEERKVAASPICPLVERNTTTGPAAAVHAEDNALPARSCATEWEPVEQ